FTFICNDSALPQLSTLSLHDALPISSAQRLGLHHAAKTSSRVAAVKTRSLQCKRVSGSAAWTRAPASGGRVPNRRRKSRSSISRSEEHTSELLSLRHLVCRLLLEKKK